MGAVRSLINRHRARALTVRNRHQCLDGRALTLHRSFDEDQLRAFVLFKQWKRGDRQWPLVPLPIERPRRGTF